jgi:hypothetical protein
VPATGVNITRRTESQFLSRITMGGKYSYNTDYTVIGVSTDSTDSKVLYLSCRLKR